MAGLESGEWGSKLSGEHYLDVKNSYILSI